MNRLVALACLALLPGCLLLVHDGSCKSDADCKAGFTCQQDVCVRDLGGSSGGSSGSTGSTGGACFTVGPAVPMGAPWKVALADVNGDGKLDLVASSVFDAQVDAWLGSGRGAFGSALTHPAPPYAALGAADFDGDGAADVVAVGEDGDGGAAILWAPSGGGDGGSLATLPAAPASELAAGDLNGDGVPDFAVATSGAELDVYLCTRSPLSCALHAYTGWSAGTSSVTLGDLDGDGKPDLAAVGPYDPVHLYFNNGDGSFAEGTPESRVSGGVVVRSADFDRDGHLDLAIGHPSQGLVLLRGKGSAGFAAPVAFPLDGEPSAMVVADLNGDSWPDIAVTFSNLPRVALLFNDHAGGFAPASYVSFPSDKDVGSSIAAGDLDGDARPDLAVSQNNQNVIQVLINACGG